jgi:hypothetical protein
VSNPDIALVYLARGIDGGLASASEFFESYHRHPAGVPHALYVIAKGWPDRAAYSALIEAAPRSSKVVDLPDDGFDLTAYHRLARDLPQEWVCFLNTFSVIESDRWLERLSGALALPSVGVAGCFGSYGTLQPRMQNLVFNAWEAARTKPPKAVLGELLAYAGDRWRTARSNDRFPAFPNPHVRTNAFMLARDTFVAFWQGKPIPQTKRSVCALESGSAGLTRFIEARGQRAVVVGADGGVYEKDQWLESRTFRVPLKANNMIADNATRRYFADDRDRRRKKEFATWGRCLTS